MIFFKCLIANIIVIFSRGLQMDDKTSSLEGAEQAVTGWVMQTKVQYLAARCRCHFKLTNRESVSSICFIDSDFLNYCVYWIFLLWAMLALIIRFLLSSFLGKIINKTYARIVRFSMSNLYKSYWRKKDNSFNFLFLSS